MVALFRPMAIREFGTPLEILWVCVTKAGHGYHKRSHEFQRDLFASTLLQNTYNATDRSWQIYFS